MESPRAAHDSTLLAIVCLSPQEWRVDLPTNRQQLMLRLRRRGCQVVFVETGPWGGRYVHGLVRGPARRSVFRQLLVGEEVPTGVRVIKAPTLLPWGHKYGLAARINARLTAWVLRRHARRLAGAVVLWLYDPCFADCIGRSGESIAVYDCVDDYPEQTGDDERKRRLVTAYDALAGSRAHLVFATARPLLERHLRHNPRTHLVRNVGDYAHFAVAADRAFAAPEVARLDRPILGFSGNLMSSKVDFELLADVAARRQDWTILLIGPVRKDAHDALERLRRLPNVHWVGGRSYDDVPAYVAAFDVAIIPYVATAYTRSCFPLKTFEYLAAGKSIVASGLPELASLEPHVLLARDADEFIAGVERALTRVSEPDVAARQELSSANTWETRAGRLLELILAELPAPAHEPRLPHVVGTTTLSE